MREAHFRKMNQAKWDSINANPPQNPDDLANAFMEISQDLSFAKTFYPDSDLVPFLNQMTAQFYAKIYVNKKEKRGVFKWFWKEGLPLVLYKNQSLLLYSLVFFLLSSLIGALAAYKNPDFIRLVLGEAYVNMTNENISKGNPFGVYKEMAPFWMFIMIMGNNIYVSFKIFTLGIFMGAGTLWSLFENGIMLGSFQYYFFSKGLGWASVLVIWIHGTLEISAIIIAGSAGLLLGKGFLFPGTLSRLSSIKLAAIEGVKIMIGLVPIFMLAAFLEGFITRHDHMPIFMSISILLFSLLLIVYYFVIYPINVFQTISNQKTRS